MKIIRKISIEISGELAEDSDTTLKESAEFIKTILQNRVINNIRIIKAEDVIQEEETMTVYDDDSPVKLICDYILELDNAIDLIKAMAKGDREELERYFERYYAHLKERKENHEL